MVINTIDLPAGSISGVAFGGPNNDVLFCTTAQYIYLPYFDLSLPTFEKSTNPNDGLVYMIKCSCGPTCKCPKGPKGYYHRVLNYTNLI